MCVKRINVDMPADGGEGGGWIGIGSAWQQQKEEDKEEEEGGKREEERERC